MAQMFGGRAAPVPQPQPIPKPLPPPTMPDPFAPDVMAARRKATEAAQRGGRTAAVLTTLGPRGAATPLAAGGSYAGSKLGG